MKRFLLSIIGVLAFAIGMNAENYTHTFKKDELTKNGGKITLSNTDWTASNATAIGWNNDRGIKLGEGTNICTKYSLSTSAFKDFTIKSVTVYSSIAKDGDAKLTIKAGNTTSEQYSLTGTHTSYKLECKEHGDIVISWEATKKVYYVSKIEIEYELPADMVDIEEPTFKTPVGLYENNVKVTVETDDQSLVLYYTMDGTTPSYEDYQNETGSTECSKYYVMYFQDTKLITQTTTIKVIAVKVDGESVYKSDVVEATYIVSPTKPHTLAKGITTGNKYAIVANDSVADFMFGETNSYLQSRKASGVYDKYIETAEYNAFTFTSINGEYTIQDAENRYMYLASTDGKISFAAEKPATGAVWSVLIDNDGKATIKNGNNTVYYSANNDVFGCYETAEADMVLPTLYMKREYPQATITPENSSSVKGLQEIIITCNEGIAVSEDFKLRAVGLQKKGGGYEIDRTYNCQLVGNNTLKFTIDTPIATEDNIDLEIVITGDIYLNPNDIKYPLPFTGNNNRTICKYTHVGDAAPAELLSVTPTNNSTIEELSHFVFTFSKEGTSKSEDAELQPRLYAEGISWNYILEKSQTNSDGKMITMAQLALKTSEPILGNGTYFLEIPTGYFIDRNGNSIEGITLKYTVKNDSGLGADIEDIIEENNQWIVYNMTGIKVLDTDNAEILNTLPKGIYIINGKKIIVK